LKARPSSIREKLQAVVVVATLAALTCALIGNIVGNVVSYHKRHVAYMGTQAELLGRMTAPALVFDDRQLASDNLALFEAQPNIHAAAIYDARGGLFATYQAPGQQVDLPDVPGLDGAYIRDADLVVYRRIVNEDMVLGTVYLRVGYDLAGIVLGAVAVAVLVGLFAMGIAFFMIRRMEKLVTAPIAAVARTAREVVQEGDYSRRVEKTSNDEVGEMVESFNAMLGEIQHSTQALETSYLEVRREAEEREIAQQEVMRLNASLEHRVQDRTADLQEANLELSAAKAAADEASRAKSNFLATMSHEIRTPMNGVIGMIDVLHQTSLNGHQVEMVDLIRDSAFSLLTVIDDILDFSKIESGRLDLEHAPLSLADMAESACGMFDHIALKKDVEFTLFVDPALPEMVLGDSQRLRQVLLNLVSNAIKFSSGREQPGRVAVRVELMGGDAGHADVGIDVIDNGIGIDEESCSRLFTAFSQADTSTTRRFGGTGLGLAISRHLVGLMGGELSVESQPGRGSTFSVRLPLELAPVAADTEAAPALAGLQCIVVGGVDGLAPDMAAYLAADGADVRNAASLAQAHGMIDGLPPGAWIWVVDAPDGGSALGEAWRSVGHSFPERELRLVAIGRGRSREPEANDAGVVSVDGNVLTRRRLSKAVAMAAGRALGPLPATQGRHSTRFEAPSREDARRNRRLILVAEDNETNQKVIVRQLALLGYAADIAANGRLALERWASGDYALLLSDLHMPVMDGYELTAAIRARETDARRMPIVALTANALKGEAERCRAAGMDDYLTKPLQLADLETALERYLPRSAVGLPRAPADDATDAAPVVDVGVLEALVGSDAEVVDSFLRDFRSSANKIALSLKQACADGDIAEAIAQAHKLKSSASTVGAGGLGELCAQIETAGKSGAADMLALLLPAFEREAEAVDAYLATRLQPSTRKGVDG